MAVTTRNPSISSLPILLWAQGFFAQLHSYSQLYAHFQNRIESAHKDLH